MSEQTQKVYDLLMKKPPIKVNHMGATIRCRGNSLHDDYWRGFDGHRSHGARGSFANAAWRAGRDTARKGIDPLQAEPGHFGVI